MSDTPTISMSVSYRIVSAHREIEIGEKLLADVKTALDDPRGDALPLDPFGRRRPYQFGLPSEVGHRMLNVTPKLAVYVLQAHIADMKRELAEACIAARMELDGLVAHV